MLLQEHWLESIPESGSASYSLLQALSFHTTSGHFGSAVRELVLAFISACSNVTSTQLEESVLETALSVQWKNNLKVWRTSGLLSFSEVLATLLAIKYPLEKALALYSRLEKYQGLGPAKEVSRTLLELISALRLRIGAPKDAINIYIQKRLNALLASTDTVAAKFAAEMTQGLGKLVEPDEPPASRLKESYRCFTSSTQNEHHGLLTAVSFVLQQQTMGPLQTFLGRQHNMVALLQAFCNPSYLPPILSSVPPAIRRLMLAASLYLAAHVPAEAALAASQVGPGADCTKQGMVMDASTSSSASSSAASHSDSQVLVPHAHAGRRVRRDAPLQPTGGFRFR